MTNARQKRFWVLMWKWERSTKPYGWIYGDACTAFLCVFFLVCPIPALCRLVLLL